MTSDSYQSRRWRTAIHEADHVLMAGEEGCRVGGVGLTKTADVNGALSQISCSGAATTRPSESRWVGSSVFAYAAHAGAKHENLYPTIRHRR